jgi:hypothetical protein
MNHWLGNETEFRSEASLDADHLPSPQFMHRPANTLCQGPLRKNVSRHRGQRHDSSRCAVTMTPTLLTKQIPMVGIPGQIARPTSAKMATSTAKRAGKRSRRYSVHGSCGLSTGMALPSAARVRSMSVADTAHPRCSSTRSAVAFACCSSRIAGMTLNDAAVSRLPPLRAGPGEVHGRSHRQFR